MAHFIKVIKVVEVLHVLQVKTERVILVIHFILVVLGSYGESVGVGSVTVVTTSALSVAGSSVGTT